MCYSVGMKQEPKIKVAFTTSSVKVPVSPASWAQGRNCICQLGELSVWGGSDGMVYLDFITRKTKTVLNGGASFDAEAMDKLAVEWVKARNLKVEAQ